MGYPSLREDVLERLTEGLSALLRDDERGAQKRTLAEDEARVDAIARVQNQIRRVLEEHLDIATTPGIDLAQKVKELEGQVAALRDDVANASQELKKEQARTRQASQQVEERNAQVATLKKEIDRLEMKVAYLSVRENGGRGGPVGSRKS